MSFLIITSQREPTAWVEALKAEAPDLDLEIYPEVKDPEKVRFALSWKHPHGVFQEYPNLEVIASMGAGIDHIIEDKSIPSKVKITRVVDDQLTKDMSVFVLSLVLEQLRQLHFHHSNDKWEPKNYGRPEEMQVGIMGLGVLGTAVAQKLHENNFKVSGWSRTKKDLDGIHTFHGQEQLGSFLETAQILVCLLPLTSETENILDKELFQQLPKGAYLINVARGKHLVEDDLLEMIAAGQLSGASLDVFRKEPLPADHPFWKNEKIKITPHIASITHPKTVIPQILENYARMKAGEPLKNSVSIDKEY